MPLLGPGDPGATDDTSGNYLRSGFEALSSGVLQHPIVGPALDYAAQILGVGPERMQSLKDGIGVDSSTEKAIRFIGHYGPDLFLGMGSYLAGGRLATRGLAEFAAARGAQAGTQLGAVLARASRDQAVKALAGQTVKTGADVALALGSEMRMPLLERAVQAAGGNLAWGAYDGARALASGESPGEAAKTAAVSAVLGGGMEMGLVGMGKLLTGRARFVDIAGVEARGAPALQHLEDMRNTAEFGAPTRAVGDRTPGVWRKQAPLVELNERLNDALGVEQQLLALRQAQGKLSKADVGRLTANRRYQADLNTRVLERTTEIHGMESVTTSGGTFSYLGNRPTMNRGLTATARALGRNLWLTPEGLREGFGVVGSRTLAAAQHADEMATIQKTVANTKINEMMDTVSKALGLSTKTATESGLLIRLQGFWEHLNGNGAQDVSHFLQTLPTESFTIHTVGGARGATNTTKTFRWRDILKPLSAADADGVAHQYQELAGLLDDNHGLVREVGGLPALTPKALQRLGVRAHMTHITQPGVTDESLAASIAAIHGEPQAQAIMSDMAQGGHLPSQREAALLNRTERGTVQGFTTRIGRFGTFDHSRSLRGTAWEKYISGIPIVANPFEAGLMATRHAAYRYHMAKVFGPRGELVDKFADLVGEEALHANQVLGLTAGQKFQKLLGRNVQPEAELNASTTRQLFRDVVDEILDNRYYDQSLTKLARTATSVNTATKMTFGVVSNLTQPGNTMMMQGLTNTIKGFKAVIKGVDPLTGASMRSGTPLHQSLVTSLGLPHAIAQSTLGFLEGGYLTQNSERVAEWLLKWSGFESAEVFNRLSAGITSRVTFKDTVIRAAQGRLRGTALDHAHRMMADLGVNLTEEAAKMTDMGAAAYWAHPETLELAQRVTFAGAQKTQFIPSRFRKPNFWQTPYGRVMFQFKTFALHQSRLLRDQVLAEFAQGNVKPFATALAVAPISGEFVATMKDLIRGDRGRPGLTQNPVLRTVDNILHFGGFGLTGDVFQSLVAGDPKGLFLGPTGESAWTMAHSLVTLNPTESVKMVNRLPIWQTLQAVYSTAKPISNEMAEQWGQFMGDKLDVQDVGDLLYQDTQFKTPTGPGPNPLSK